MTKLLFALKTKTTLFGELCRCRGSLGLAAGVQPVSRLLHARSCLAATVQDVQEQVDSINEKFTEARELIADAQDEAETVYFDEAHAEARDAVEVVLHEWQQVLVQLEDAEKGKLQRSMGLKIEQLKAELGNLDQLHT